MIKAHIQKGGQSAVIELPTDRFNLHRELWGIGIREKATDVKLTNADDEVCKIMLESDSDFGNSIIKLFSADYSLDALNACVYKLANIREELRDDLEGDILHEQFESPEDLMEDIENRTSELINVTVDYYCPLAVQMLDDGCVEFYDVDNSYAAGNEDVIREKLMEVQQEDLNDMAYYFDRNETAKEKLISAIWDVEEVNGILYGVIHTHLTERFTAEEEQAWIEELVAQASDGLGEIFEQREISIDDGYITISFGGHDKDYFMENESDFRARIGQTISGMEMNPM